MLLPLSRSFSHGSPTFVRPWIRLCVCGPSCVPVREWKQDTTSTHSSQWSRKTQMPSHSRCLKLMGVGFGYSGTLQKLLFFSWIMRVWCYIKGNWHEQVCVWKWSQKNTKYFFFLFRGWRDIKEAVVQLELQLSFLSLPDYDDISQCFFPCQIISLCEIWEWLFFSPYSDNSIGEQKTKLAGGTLWHLITTMTGAQCLAILWYWHAFFFQICAQMRYTVIAWQYICQLS